ncbi:MAG TPA: cytochrome c biogenesis protein ResB [Bacteroidales bacterium]|nr:cytochrome c biogenesis protein ResB [Bacteroidales bacterium]
MNEANENITPERKFGQFPWKFRESILISAGLLLSGFIIELLSGGKGFSMPGWPSNILILLLFIAYIVAFHLLVKHPLKKWLSSTYAAISAVGVFALLLLLMGIIPQNNVNADSFLTKSGLDHITRSWPFLLCSFNLLLVLSLTIIRRLWPFSLKNAAFILNHFGLWIVIVAASLGATDSIKLNMVLQENKTVFIASDDQGRTFDVNIGLKLLKFSMDEYPPELGLINASDGSLKIPAKNLLTVKKGNKGMMGGWIVGIENYIENAYQDSAGFVPTASYGSAPAVFINVSHKDSGKTYTGWVSSGSPYIYPQVLDLQNGEAIAMTVSKPRRFVSLVRAYSTMNESRDFVVEVNKPAKYKGWTVYQAGYDQQMGKWSRRSVLQLVRDPWLPVVYTGIFMIMAGALYLLWCGRPKRTTE